MNFINLFVYDGLFANGFIKKYCIYTILQKISILFFIEKFKLFSLYNIINFNIIMS